MIGDERALVRLAALATATPPYEADQSEAQDFFLRHFGHLLSPRSLGLLKRFLAHPSIQRRRFALEHPDCLVSEDPDQRLARFSRWALNLSAQAGRTALRQAGLASGEVAALVVNTCTGYLCPGLSSYLIESLDLPRNIRAYDLVGGGCGGALPNLQVAQEYLRSAGKGAALCVSVEICSATFHMEDDLSLILSNTLFGDGAAAAALWTRPRGLELVASSSRHAPEDREAIRYVHKHGELYNQLSRDLPRLASKAVVQAVQELLASQGLRVAEVDHWALHGGGNKVLEAVARELGLAPEKLLPARQTLARFGNMSSPSVFFTLKDILNNGLRPRDWIVMVSFGAGLSAHALLLRSS